MKNFTPIILFFAAIAVRLVVYFATHYAVDDAFITFRYAANIANGNGLVYNLGERVLGTSTPLFTGYPPPAARLWVGYKSFL